MEALQISKVTAAYSGRAGACCCGCKGKHYSKRQGTPNDFKQMGRIFSKVEALVNDKSFEINSTYAAAEEGNRLYVVYFDER